MTKAQSYKKVLVLSSLLLFLLPLYSIDSSIKEYVKSMSLEEKAAQVLITNIEGNKEYKAIEELTPGGFLFFRYNLQEKQEDIIKFTTSILAYYARKGKTPPFLALDQEGGSVNRLRLISAPLPSPRRVVECLTAEEAKTLYELQGQQMAALGFNLNLSPIVEVENKDNQEFLGDRCYGDLKKVLEYSTACISGFQSKGVLTVAKHYPGDTKTDPHLSLPTITFSNLKENESASFYATSPLLTSYLTPFKNAIKMNAAGILTSYIVVRPISEDPACLSNIWIEGILRGALSYGGLVVSDDIYMKALSEAGYKVEDALIKAVEAGVNLIISSEKRITPLVSVIVEKANKDSNFNDKLTKSVEKIIEYKVKYNLLTTTSDNKIIATEAGSGKVETGKRMEEFMDAWSKNVTLYRKKFM